MNYNQALRVAMATHRGLQKMRWWHACIAGVTMLTDWTGIHQLVFHGSPVEMITKHTSHHGTFLQKRNRQPKLEFDGGKCCLLWALSLEGLQMKERFKEILMERKELTGDFMLNPHIEQRSLIIQAHERQVLLCSNRNKSCTGVTERSYLFGMNIIYYPQKCTNLNCYPGCD